MQIAAYILVFIASLLRTALCVQYRVQTPPQSVGLYLYRTYSTVQGPYTPGSQEASLEKIFILVLGQFGEFPAQKERWDQKRTHADLGAGGGRAGLERSARQTLSM